MKHDCFRCGACCKNHTILITFHDLRVIHRRFPKLRLEKIITLFEVDSNYRDYEFLVRHYPIIYFNEYKLVDQSLYDTKLNTTEKEFPSSYRKVKISGFLGLKFIPYYNFPLNARDSFFPSKIIKENLSLGEKPSETILYNFNQIRVCPFFDIVHNLCTIHEYKPLVCKTYPHVLSVPLTNPDNNHNNMDGRVVEFQKETARCPEPWIYEASKINKLKELLIYAEDEYERFKVEVNEWNKIFDTKNLEDFLKFILGHKKKGW
ncbi:MAG: YkgJ family cysteine cluster protein [Promethearchaeota archaeon]